ncbi:uncharacterized protein K460DRAFT_280850 [Cucurbitaria berberidis CBS 394.84]|uniref:Uncharacterized protein n=1 Tax=Cucurbitaria berberidis CBS 394.84 TaxID=1168544 RepID=A0A9P4GQM1_9PLEO|nr:uncharacterized protein K460DRAFT_280850 [Cucurbitaria berberidis CBS 394.84]KAF1849534.1 hypothetical protein K460DRAFT_280850 [Cucurbitaria berberidis CBS 394.84]
MPAGPTPKKLYRFQSPKQKVSLRSDNTKITRLTKVKRPELTTSPASNSNLTAVQSESPSPFQTETPPTTLSSGVQVLSKEHDIASIRPSKEADCTELDATIAGMHAAEKLLHQRHAAIKPQPNIGKKIKPLGAIIKKSSPKASSPKARVPLSLSSPIHRRQQPETANEACASFQRRQLIKNLAFNAANGCPNAIADMDQINAHFTLRSRLPETTIPDLILEFGGVQIRASQLVTTDHNWIARFNALTNNSELVESRRMSPEDHETIALQLFPEERSHILKPEYFEIFVTGLGEEGTLTQAEAKAIGRLGVTVEEFEQGGHFTGPSKYARGHRHNPTELVIFEIPKQASRGLASFSPRPSMLQGRDLYYHLRILIEAAVYDQKFWKGYFFANARSKLGEFYEAYNVSQEGWPLPANLTEYKRPWTSREIRLLQRGQLLCDLLKKYETAEMTDFGIIRAVRGTYVQIPAQPFFSVEALESFLYHRIADSGLAVSRIPEILALHPENDAVFANPVLRNYVVDSLNERAENYEKEEEQRLSEIETSYTTFETVRKAQMTPWERIKVSFKKVFGKKEVVVPFDPFSPEHEVEGQQQ